MGFELDHQFIRILCGRFAYEEGEDYYRDGRVTITGFEPVAAICKATVVGTNNYEVTIEADGKGEIHAECTCSDFYSYGDNCKHIAAVLLNIHEIQHSGMPVLTQLPGDSQLINGMLGLFGGKPLRPSGTRQLFDTRDSIDVEFVCKPILNGSGAYIFGIEMKIGTARMYIIQKIREFLDRVDRKESFVLSKQFTYDPELYGFRKEDDAVIRQLIRIYHNERLYHESSQPNFKQDNRMSTDRMLLIPPFAWEIMLPLLAVAPSVRLEQGGHTYDGIRLSDEPVPLQFEFDQAESDGYLLHVQGMDQITIMEPYGIVLSEGKLLKLQAGLCKRLAELKQMLEASRRHQVQISPEHMEPFMEKVIPGLMQLGSVHIARAVSDRIVQTPLKAKLYLDRVRDRLLAGLEFQYGDIVINPLEGTGQKRGADRILVRDGEQEERILELMEQSAFAKTESGYFMEGEEEEYDFLYHTVPQLQRLVEIYATSAVKERLHTGHAPPKVSVDVDERTDWLEFRFDMEGIPESEIRNLLISLKEKRKYYRMPNGALLPLESVEFQEIVQLMNDSGIRNMDVLGSPVIRLPVVNGLHLMDTSKQGHAVRLGKSFRRLLENIRNPDHLEFPVPDSLTPVLRDYQKYGFGWLKTLAHYGFGGILADEMGLGKTVQSIAFLVSVLPELRKQGLPALIVSPSSLLYNWRNECRKFAPELRAVIADGSKSERTGLLKVMSGADVIITSYPLLRRDMELYAAQSFHTLILDEAQLFKNHATQTARAVKAIQARYRFALTGTPVENRLEELWSIFDAVFPALFPGGRRAFQELSRETVAKRARPFLLRRLKTDVLKELPEKIETLQTSELLPDQKKLYAAYLAELQQETLKHLNEEGLQKHRIKILAGLTRLRQLCCHPALFVEGYSGSSAKFEQLMEMVEECRSAGRRMLVFSQFTGMLGLIGRELGLQGVPHFYLDGQTPTAERVELCSRFNEGERDLFLISLKAGGTGLNLTGADTVILYDLWWNPAVEQQAADRAHRIGQKKTVHVIRLVAQGTVEDKMYELQQRKKSLINEVIQPGQEALSALSEQEIKELLMIN